MNMPMDSSTLLTTRSMTRKGRKSRKPIWKAVLSSDSTKAGTTTRRGSSPGSGRSASVSAARMISSSASSANRASSFWRVLLTRKVAIRDQATLLASEAVSSWAS